VVHLSWLRLGVGVQASARFMTARDCQQMLLSGHLYLPAGQDSFFCQSISRLSLERRMCGSSRLVHSDGRGRAGCASCRTMCVLLLHCCMQLIQSATVILVTMAATQAWCLNWMGRSIRVPGLNRHCWRHQQGGGGQRCCVTSVGGTYRLAMNKSKWAESASVYTAFLCVEAAVSNCSHRFTHLCNAAL
jgi:hypothetical protein